MTESDEELRIKNALLENNVERDKYNRKQYALKFVEYAMVGFMVLILTAVIGAILSLVIKNYGN